MSRRWFQLVWWGWRSWYIGIGTWGGSLKVFDWIRIGPVEMRRHYAVPFPPREEKEAT